MTTQIQIERTKIQAAHIRRTGSLLILTAMILGLSACAGLEGSPRAEAPPALASVAEKENSHATLEDAARAALVEAWTGTVFHNRDRLRVGSIVQSDGEFVWLEPQSSKAGPEPVVRLGVRANHAATYIVHPRTGSTTVDRANEQITKHEKRLVDRIDPLHRPIFILTPSGRVLAYSHGAPVVELASMRDRNRSSNSPREARIAELAK
jgi:hypothetical protein